jgi:hypothetical protein
MVLLACCVAEQCSAAVSCVAMVSGGPPLLHCSVVRVCGGGGDGVRLVTLKFGDGEFECLCSYPCC